MNTDIDLQSDFPEKSQSMAEDFFQRDFLNCAEAVLKSLMLNCGRDCPPELFRLAAAFGRSMGSAGCTCGALVGGEMALGALWGGNAETGAAPEHCVRAAKLLHDRFKKNNGATCRILHKGQPYGSDEQLASCRKRTGESAKLAAQIIMEYKNPPPETKTSEDDQSEMDLFNRMFNS